jgi:iron complex transport system substrate-binding protein
LNALRVRAGDRTRWLAALLLATALAPGAAAQGTFVDDRGARVVLPAVPRRIVSLLPSLTESVCALGACSLLVGTDRFSNWPRGVDALPKLGGLDDTQIESLVALKPDVVLAATSARVIDRLESLGLKVIVLESRNRADLRRALTLLGGMLGRPAAAEALWSDIERETRAAAGQVPAPLRGKRVYFEIDPTPYAAGAGSFVGETLAQLGMTNAIPAALGPFPKLNPEYVVRIQPDIIIATRQTLSDMRKRPGWSSLRALQDEQTCGLSGERFELLVRPGPRMGEAAEVLATCLAAMTRPR